MLLAMKQFGESSLQVGSAEVAEVVTRVQQLQELRHFMTDEGSTVRHFARAMDWSDVRAYRQVERYLSLGLLAVLREQQRAGRAIKVYHCPYRSFFVPFSLFSAEEYLALSFQPYEADIRAQLAQAVRTGPDALGGFLCEAVGEQGVALVPADRQGRPWQPGAPGGPALHYSICPLYLSYEQAQDMARELEAVLEKYGQLGGSARYLYQVILTPDQRG